MDADRLNPVILITAASSGFGHGYARTLASYAQGGLILIDYDEATLEASADELGARGSVPERVSTLAFDVGDEERWSQAERFIRSQYGRLDWALLNASAAPASELVEWGRPRHLESVFYSLRATMRLMHDNSAGGSIIVSAPASELKAPAGSNASLMHLVDAAAKEGAHDNIRVNALLTGGGGDTPGWPELPWFRDLVRECGEHRAALERIAQLPQPVARYASADDIRRLIMMLLSDDTHATGAALVVDGGYTL
ncbi:MAG TPA: SDR family oxidoreductase [Vitreimonas sp.]|uniref:SDR family NAD(P)-dependent oxidoreductase n=1 Tax=Vitreimonas sp. TaxID=3069702 RepID=UPI002D4E104B|nr:SDR family oxidoreductase [Vitreimonas sp.]HYD88246.1 SDR family oxidoreductase [Vitreimonas sp.]